MALPVSQVDYNEYINICFRNLAMPKLNFTWLWLYSQAKFISHLITAFEAVKHKNTKEIQRPALIVQVFLFLPKPWFSMLTLDSSA